MMGTEKPREEIQISLNLGEGGKEEFESGTPKVEEVMTDRPHTSCYSVWCCQISCTREKPKGYHPPESHEHPVAR